MSAYGEAFVRENTGAKYRLVSHESRPQLTLIHPATSEKRPSSFRFIDAVTRLTSNFLKKEWEAIYEKAGARLHAGQLRQVFVILSDEDRVTPSSRSDPPASGGNAQPLSFRGGRGGRGGGSGRGGRGTKHGAEDQVVATPAKVRRGK